MSGRARDAVRCEPLGDRVDAFTGEIVREDAQDDRGSDRICLESM
jgi:hypothetical protein